MYLCTSFYANILLMKKNLLLTVCLLAAINGSAQKKDFSYKFYGQIRTDLYYNSRANQETVYSTCIRSTKDWMQMVKT